MIWVPKRIPIDVAQPAYYDKLNTVLKSIPISNWKIYLKAYTIKNYADELSQTFCRCFIRVQ